MEIKVEITKGIFTQLVKTSIKNAFGKVILVATCVALLAGFIDGFQNGFTFPSSIINPVIVFFILLIIITIIWIIKIYGGYKKLKKYKSLKYTYSLLPEGIKLEKQDRILYFRWFEVKNVSIISNFMAIALKKGSQYLIPLSTFQNQEQQHNFFNTIRNETASAEFTPPPHPSYWRGLLGLIPLVGLINGIIMLRAGITNYKDKKYSLIGFAGIAFSFILFYLADSSKFPTPKVFRESLIYNSQMNLNSLLKEIEFYKIENSSYPDSLQQLNIEDEFVNINDPLIDNKNNAIYNYQKIGKKYTLFSSGLDGIPNTLDDIYPSLNIDTSKIGLIIKRK